MTGKLFKVLVCFGISVVFIAAAASPAFAGKKNDTLYFSWKKELESLDRYFNTAREGMIVSRQICDDLLYPRCNTNPCWQNPTNGSTTLPWNLSCARASHSITVKNLMPMMWCIPSTL
jgi:hypothetical protein